MTLLNDFQGWPVTTERFVVFIDIMGFKNMVATQPLESIYKMMKEINLSRTNIANTGLMIDKEEMKLLIRSTTYSDSIMLYSKDSSPESLNTIIVATSRLTGEMFEKNVPHKGALACGIMTLDNENSIFFGQSLIDAYLLQEELQFYGIILHHTAELKLTKDTFKGCITQYECPLKNGTVNHKAIFPFFLNFYFKETNPSKHEAIMEGLKSMYFIVSGHLRKYYDNTKKYFDHILEETRKLQVLASTLKTAVIKQKSD